MSHWEIENGSIHFVPCNSPTTGCKPWKMDYQRHLVLLYMFNSNVNRNDMWKATQTIPHPSLLINWTVSDHQWSKALKLQIGFTLRMWNCVSSSWFERLRISDRKFVNHTTEMILWSMILEIALWAVGFNRGQPRQLVSMEFCSASLERDWSIDWGDFWFSFWCPSVKKAQQIAVAQTPCCRFQIQSSEQIEKSDANAICIVFCVL